MIEELPKIAPEPLSLLLPPTGKSISLVVSSSELIEVLSRKIVLIDNLPKKAPEPHLLLLPPPRMAPPIITEGITTDAIDTGIEIRVSSLASTSTPLLLSFSPTNDSLSSNKSRISSLLAPSSPSSILSLVLAPFDGKESKLLVWSNGWNDTERIVEYSPLLLPPSRPLIRKEPKLPLLSNGWNDTERIEEYSPLLLPPSKGPLDGKYLELSLVLNDWIDTELIVEHPLSNENKRNKNKAEYAVSNVRDHPILSGPSSSNDRKNGRTEKISLHVRKKIDVYHHWYRH